MQLKLFFSRTPLQDSKKKPAASRTSATSELEFPPMHEIVQKSIVGDATIFQWAHRYAERIDEFLTSSNLAPYSWKGVQVSTEFSGTGCAEASYESAAIQAGFAPEDIHFRYAADIDKYCRRVLTESCPCFSCFNFHKQSQHLHVSFFFELRRLYVTSCCCLTKLTRICAYSEIFWMFFQTKLDDHLRNVR